jgi:hypothetical protein
MSLSQLTNYEPSISELEALFVFPGHYSYTGDLPVRRTVEDEGPWAIGPTLLSPSADLLAECNADTLTGVLRAVVGPPRSEDASGSWDVVSVAHWSLGWVEHLSVMVYAEDGTVTPAARIVLGAINRFRTSPALDIHEYGKRVRTLGLEATVESIDDTGSPWLAEEAPEDWATRVFAYLAKKHPDEVTFANEDGAEPSEIAVRRAMKALGYFDNNADD